MLTRFGVQIRAGPLSSIIQQSVLCEQYGFDSIWYPDHFVGGNPGHPWPEAFSSMALMGIKTSKVLVGPAVTDALRRHPATIAQAMATLDQFSQGRAVLGIGAGEAMNLHPYGISMEKLYGKLREAIQVIRTLWASDPEKPANFVGDHYSLKNAFLQVRPIRKPLPIYIGAFGPEMLKMTGELADGWLPFSHTPHSYERCLKGPIREGAERAGRSLSGFEPAMLPATAISKSREEAEEQIRRAAKRLLVLLPEVLRMIAPDVDHPGTRYTLVHWMGRLKDQDMDVISNVAESIPTELALKTVIHGTPDDCIGQIENFIEAGCRHFVFGIRGRDVEEKIRLLGEEVVDYFKEPERT